MRQNGEPAYGRPTSIIKTDDFAVQTVVGWVFKSNSSWQLDTAIKSPLRSNIPLITSTSRNSICIDKDNGWR